MSYSSKSRERAETAFGKAQSQSLARNRTMSEAEATVRAREEKTARLRELRKAKEAEDLAAGLTPAATRKSR